MRWANIVRGCLAGLAVLAATGCTDLDVTNPNEPDTEKVLRTPGDVESLIASSFHTWWHANNIRYPTMALATMANQHSSRWADWGMQDLAAEPRVPITNDVGWDFTNFLETPWYGNYRANKAANDGLSAILERDMELGQNGSDTPRGLAFARFVQGLAHGQIALLFDQGFVVDETADISEMLELVPYTEVLAQAVRSLEQAIEIAEANTFTIPATAWINGLTTTNQELARLAHSFLARFLASAPRSPAERKAVDWEKVIYHAERGMQQEWGPIQFGDDWWAGHHWMFSTYRTSLRLVGLADQSGAYQAWEAAAPTQKRPFLIDTDDRRVTGGDPTTSGKYTAYMTSSLVPDERGVWFQSNYRHSRWDWIADGEDGTPLINITPTEMRLLIAEGHYWNGEEQLAAEIVNETRVAIGELPPVDISGTTGARCTPRRRDGSCGDLFDALKWEKYLETMQTASGLMFFDKRGWGELYPGTPLQLPVPARELIERRMPVYTFGGGGAGSAPAWQ
jgi:hypothetical protein